MPGLRISLLALAAALAPQAARAEPPTLQAAIGNPKEFKLSTHVRARYEVLDGQPRPGLAEQDEQLAIRTIVTAEYRRDTLRLGAELYDSRVYFAKPGGSLTTNDVNALELVQLYAGADLNDALGKDTATQLQFGRMTLNLGSRRLVAADDYRNTTNGYTGLRADVKTGDGTTATLIYMLPQVRLPDDSTSLRANAVAWDRESFDLQLWGGLVARPKTIAGATAELGYFRLQENDRPNLATRDRDLHTVSARIIRDPKPARWDFEIEGIYQLGGTSASASPAAARLDVDAWFLHADVGYSFAGPAKLRLSVEYDRASGDAPGGRFGRFDTLFGMRRAELAPAGLYNAIGRANISTPGLRAEVAPSTRFDAFVVYRALWLAERTDAFSTTGVRDPSGQSGSFAGHQIEARLRYWFVPSFLRGEVNAVWLAKGRFLKEAPDAPATGDTRYLATALTASF